MAIDIKEKIIQKSIEAFVLGIEMKNKPTIKYRIEGFAMFICNAWELILKAHMLNIGENIYYKDNPNRTITLEKCVQKVFTNDKDPLRINIEKIIELKNTSTHFITEEYEIVYVPLFQSCVLNFNEKMMLFHNVDMTETIPQNFLTLFISMKALSESEIIAKYPEEIATKILASKNNIDQLSKTNNDSFAIRIDHHHYITKDKNKATSIVGIDNSSSAKVKIMKKVKNPNDTHKYPASKIIFKIKEALIKQKIPFKTSNDSDFNNHHFKLFCNYYNLKNNETFCFIHTQFKDPRYTYSQHIIDFIVNEIKKDPHNIMDHIKSSLNNKD